MVDCGICKYYQGNSKCMIGGENTDNICSDFEIDKEFIDKTRVIPEGKKYDTGKNRMGLMCANFSRALWEVGKVSTFGANRYGANNWQYLENPKERYMDALCRHLFQHLQGEKINEESGLLHLSHCAWNILALIEFELKDDNMCCALKQSLDKVREGMEVGGILKALKESEDNNG